MGDLSRLAKKNSNWLLFNVGESVIVKYLDFKIVPSSQDPTKEVVQYKLLEDGQEKYWQNGSSKIMRAFDEFKPGETWVKISRNPWLDKQNKVVEGKSSYEVEKVDAPVEQPATPTEKAWDE